MKPNPKMIALVATLFLTISLAGCAAKKESDGMTADQANKLIDIGKENNELLHQIPTTPPASAEDIAAAVAANHANDNPADSAPSPPAAATESWTLDGGIGTIADFKDAKVTNLDQWWNATNYTAPNQVSVRKLGEHFVVASIGSFGGLAVNLTTAVPLGSCALDNAPGEANALSGMIFSDCSGFKNASNYPNADHMAFRDYNPWTTNWHITIEKINNVTTSGSGAPATPVKGTYLNYGADVITLAQGLSGPFRFTGHDTGVTRLTCNAQGAGVARFYQSKADYDSAVAAHPNDLGYSWVQSGWMFVSSDAHLDNVGPDFYLYSSVAGKVVNCDPTRA